MPLEIGLVPVLTPTMVQEPLEQRLAMLNHLESRELALEVKAEECRG